MMAQDTSEVFCTILRIEHPSLSTALLITDNTEPLQRADGIYMPYGFKVTLPSQVEDSPPAVTVTVDNTDLELARRLRTLIGAPSITFAVVLASSPDVAESGPFYYSMLNLKGDADTLQGSLSYDEDIWAQTVPNEQYNPLNSPGLYT